MSAISRRTMIRRGLVAAAGLSGLAVAERIADRYGLVPPDHGGIYGPGETLTYAAQRLLTRHSLAREFSRSQISNPPFANETAPPSDHFKRLQADGFKDWRLSVEGLVAQPVSLVAFLLVHVAMVWFAGFGTRVMAMITGAPAPTRGPE